jgi:hypothetical protein
MSWLTGNLVIDWAAIVGTTFCVGSFVAFVLWALRDKLRGSAGEHWRPIGEAAPALLEPAPVAEPEKPRSPFAPRQKEGAK